MTKHTWDFFFRTWNRDAEKMWSDDNVRIIRVELLDNTTLTDALEAARKAGMSMGTHHTGCFQVQNHEGIWSREDGKAFFRRSYTASFKSWEQIEAA